MNKLYHKIAVVSACTALSFALGANKEAKAATFNLTPTNFSIGATVLSSYPYFSNSIFTMTNEVWTTNFFVEEFPPRYSYTGRAEGRQFYEFNIDSLAFDTNTVISRAFLNTPIDNVSTNHPYMNLDLYGYVGNGRPDIDDFNAGRFLGSQDALNTYPFHQAEFDVTNFVSQLLSNGNGFAGFGIRVGIGFLQEGFSQDEGRATLSYDSEEPTLIIETVDVPDPTNVPEPTTIFGSALALSVGGWLKRKKSSHQNKTTPQH